jgi:hypothetical protein
MILGRYPNRKIQGPLWRRPFRFHPITLRKQFFQVPNVVRDPRFHGRSDAQGLVRAAEVVIGEVQSVGAPQVVPLLAEGVGKASHAAHLHADR